MGLLSKLFGSHEPEDNDTSRLEKAAMYVVQNGDSGFSRHYSAAAVRSNIRFKTGAEISEDEAVELVQDYRKMRGWSPRSKGSFFPPED